MLLRSSVATVLALILMKVGKWWGSERAAAPVGL